MSHLKIVVVGAGSYIFGPSMLSQVILEHRLDGIELALLDIDEQTVHLMAAVGQRMARESGVNLQVTAYTDRQSAFVGADFVISAVIREMHKRFMLDRTIIDQYIPGHLQSEYGGISGISNSLRQITLVREISDDMRRWCPDAWLLNISNPLTRVCQAAHENGIKTAGFCAVALEAYAMAWQIINGTTIHYPFSPAIDQWQAVTAGLNHFVWLLQLRERASGNDLLPKLKDKLQAGGTSGNPVAEQMLRQTGYLLVPIDNHTMDFLPPQETMTSIEEPSHGSLEDRQTRLQRLRDVAEGQAGWDSILGTVSWERPIQFIEGVALGKDVHFDSLNLINDGQISNLPRNVFVETPIAISQQQLQPQTLELPSTVIAFAAQAAQVTDLIVQAGMKHSRKLVHEAVQLDPTIVDKAAGLRAIDASLEANADILGVY